MSAVAVPTVDADIEKMLAAVPTEELATEE